MKLKQISSSEAKELLLNLKEGVLCLNTGEARSMNDIEFYDLDMTDVRRAAVLLGDEKNMFFTRVQDG